MHSITYEEELAAVSGVVQTLNAVRDTLGKIPEVARVLDE